MDEIFSVIAAQGGARVIAVADEPSGLRAFIAIDDTTLGPAAGGVRTMRYPSAKDGLTDALRLARAMTSKCSLAGLDAGGGKTVVLLHDGLHRKAAFTRLGQVIEELGGIFRTAGDVGTTAEDLQTMASFSRYVHTDERHVADAVGRGILRCIEACAAVRGVASAGLVVAIQGAGSIGASTARCLVAAGMHVVIADIDEEKAAQVAAEVPQTRVVRPDRVLYERVDVIAPCALGGVITEDVARSMQAWAVCGGANNALASAEVAHVLAARGVLHVPDAIASAGAVIYGIGKSVMNLAETNPLIDRLGDTTREVLEEAALTRKTPLEVAELRARRRIDARHKNDAHNARL
jgi:leucine dehydrogenase